MAAVVVAEAEEDEGEDEDEDEEDDEDDDDENQELVGYLEDPPSERERRLLTRQFFPSKVGGRPAWLVPERLPDETAVLTCRRCASRLRFLLQVYASQGTRKESCFHRTVLLFVCTNCQPNEAVALRAQLPRANGHYSSEEPDREAILEEYAVPVDEEIEALCCQNCGLPCSNPSGLCSDCARRARNKDAPVCFNELELSVESAEQPDYDDEEKEGGEAPRADEAADDAEGDDPDAYAAEMKAAADAIQGIKIDERSMKDKEAIDKLTEYQDMVKQDPQAAMDKYGANWYDEWLDKRSTKDPLFKRFTRFTVENKGHVLRYELGGDPLWFSHHKRLKGQPPNCPYCGSKRIFEFQVQPQLIALLKGSPLQDRLDFGTICIFSCEESCDAKPGSDHSPYFEEFVYVQPEPVSEWIPKDERA